MPSLHKMLKKEYKTIKENEDIGKRNDCQDLLISARFSDNHLHHILPNQKVTDKIVEDLITYTSNNFNKSEVDDNIEENQKVPSEIIFKNRQAFGDILTMTCMVRDFKNQFPETRVGVHSTCMHVWDHNPHIDHTFRPGTLENDKKVFPCGPGFLTNKSGLWDYHMCNAFRMDVQNKLGVKITQGPIRSDIWMTEEEYNRRPVIDIDKPYWIFVYGGEPGWPSKQYHRWQEVINILKDDITFIQLGVKKHPYPVLDNVVDFVGRTEDRDTGIRDLFNIFLHAQGSMGLVSMHMHLSAAFNNPSVVVAGGREPASFTQYYGHQYIHTNGTMACSETKACWACKLEGCKNLVTPTRTPTKGHISEQVPKCVDIIDPEEVAESVRKYYRGGRLKYGKKIPNTFFKNIVKEKKVFSIPEPDKVDSDLLKKFGFEWGGGSITDRDWMFLTDVIKTYKVKNIVEFGAGLSSLLFSTKVNNVVTFETQPGWIKKIQDMANANNYIYQWDGKKLDIDFDELSGAFDLAFVDGPAGGKNREFSTMYGSKLADIVIVHDAGREWERKWQDKYLKNGFVLVAKGGHRCHLWIKKEIAEKNEEEEKERIRAELENDNRPVAKVVTTARGYGGSERSTIKIMSMLQKKGYRVDFISTGNISGEFNRNIPEGVLIRNWEDITEECDILTFYASDTIWNYNKSQYIDIMDKLNAKRKVFILNYKIGGAGNIEWTKGWDKYLFLNSTNEKELLKRIPDANTKVLPPPTDLDEFFKVNIDYENGIRLGRHSSQRDAKHHPITNDFINQVWNEIGEDIEFYYMPSWSKTFDDSRIHKYKVNEVKISEFLSKINVFFYMLPDGYTDAGPRVILEAMSCGIPVIADNHTGPADRVTEETGWLCNNINDYLDAINEIYNNPSIIKEKGIAARKYAKENFIPERWVEEIIG